MARKLFAMVDDQGTACHETGLCELHKDRLDAIPVPHDVVDTTLVDVSRNEAIECQVCGYKPIYINGYEAEEVDGWYYWNEIDEHTGHPVQRSCPVTALPTEPDEEEVE